MGLISGVTDFFVGGIKSFIKKPSLGSAAAAALDVASVTPIGGISKAAKIGSSVGKVASKVVGAVVDVAKAIIPKTTKGKFIAAIAAPVAYGFVTTSPELTKKAITETPGSLVDIGQGLANAAENITEGKPKEATNELLQTAKDNPVLTGLAGLGVASLISKALGLGALLVGQKVFSQDGKQVRLSNATEEQLIKLIEEKEKKENPEIPNILPTETPKIPTTTPPVLPTTPQNQNAAVPVSQPLSGTAASSTPITPSTVEVKEARPLSSTTRRKRTTRQIQKQNISQRVNILMNTGRFINSRRFRH